MSEDPTRVNVQLDPLARRMSGVAIHGDTPFDVPFISHIEGNLYTGGCANGLILPRHIEHVISLYPWETYTVRHELRSLTQVRQYDADPDERLLDGLAAWGAACVAEAPTLIHCQAGLNRSGLLAALVLMLGPNPRSAQEAIALLRGRRSPAVLCNPQFVAWLERKAA